jgi:hypothetical protein
MVARNFRSPNRRREIDLIGWHNDPLCFVEVKTHTTHPAAAAEPRPVRCFEHSTVDPPVGFHHRDHQEATVPENPWRDDSLRRSRRLFP